MRAKKITLTALVLALLGALVFVGLRMSSSSEKKTSEEVSESNIDALRRKRAARAEPATPVVAAGTVRRASDQAPVAGALVLLTRIDISVAPKSTQEEPMTALTDESGRWELEVPAGKYGISASAVSFMAATLKDVMLESGRNYENLDLELVEGGILLSGVVSDIGGGPIGGVRVFSYTKGAGLMDVPVPVATSTDDEGKYQLQLREGRYHLAATHEYYVRQETTVRLEETAEKDFALIPAAVIQGQVVSSVDGKPVPHASVRATGGGVDEASSFGASGEMTECDAEGRFILKGLKAGALDVSARAEGFSTSEPNVVEIGIAETIDEVLVIVEPAFTISGFVVQKGNEKTGVAGVFVMGMNMAAQSFVWATETSGDDGYFEIHGVQPGAFSLMVAGEDVVPDLTAASVSVKDADLSDVVLVTDVGVTVKGRVEPPQAGSVGLDIDGEVGMLNMFRAMALRSNTGEVNEDGSFELSNVPSGKLKLVASAKDGSSGSELVRIGNEDLDEIVLVLEARAKVAGVVVDASGAPVPGVEVSAQAKSGGMPFDSADAPSTGVDKEGRFELVGLDPGKYEISVSDSRGELTWESEEGAPSIDVEGTNPMTGLRLVVKSPGGVISGVVRDADGQPLADAWVGASKHDREFEFLKSLEEAGESEEPVLTGPDGRFRFTHLRDGNYRLTASSAKGGARAKKARVRPGDEVELQLAPLASLSGVVTMDGRPVEGYRITLEGPMSRNKKVSNAKGAYIFDRLESGSYKVVAVADSGSVSEKVTIESSDQSVDLKMSGWCSLRGKVLDARSDEPIEDLIVMAHMQASQQDLMSRGMDLMMGRGPKTNGDGVFEIEKLGCGEGSLSFMVSGGGFGGMRPLGFESITLEPGEEHDLGTKYMLLTPPVDDDKLGTLGMRASSSRNVENPDAMEVASVAAKGPAEKAGVQKGDRILRVNEVEIEKLGARSARKLFYPGRYAAGDTVSVSIQREGETMDFDIVAELVDMSDLL